MVEIVNRVQARPAEIESVLPRAFESGPSTARGEVVRRRRTRCSRILPRRAVVIAILFSSSYLHASRSRPRDRCRAVCGPRDERFGLTANLMSLGALDFGLIVDASVVM